MKYKHAGAPGYYYKIDDLGNKSSSFNEGKPKTMGAGFFKEMKEWEAAGGVIEPQYTAEELTQKESDDLARAIENQKSQCLQLLDDSDKKLVADSPYSAADKTLWKTFRTALRAIIKSDQLEEIPDKPF